MCIAILNTKISTLKKDTLSNCWKNNGDGAGILYIDDNQCMQVFKEMVSFENFYDNYLDIKKKYGKRNIVLHFRISTHGKVNATNCHPFLVSPNLGFVHNGMIHKLPVSKDYSDTYMFNESILKKLKDGFEYDQDMLDLIADYIGSGSKLIFLNSDNDYAIVNEKAGHWADGCWFSNTSYQSVNDWYDFGGVKKYKSKISPIYNAKTFWNDNDDWYGGIDNSAEKIIDPVYCECCDYPMVGDESEEMLELGICSYCAEDYINDGFSYNREGEQVSVCDCCNSSVGAYNQNWQGFVCSSCSDDLSA